MLINVIWLLPILIALLVFAVVQYRNIQKLNALLLESLKSEDDKQKSESSVIEYESDSVDNEQIEELKVQLKSKTIELAKVAKENEEKNQILNEVKQKVAHCANNPSSLPRVTRDVLAMLDSAIITHDSTFEIQIDELHQEFSKKMKHKYPDLTAHDLRLATYIKIGLNSKEISELLNIKPSSVYISRSRLRKKIDMDTDTDLHGYLNSI